MEGFPAPPDKRTSLNDWDKPPFNRWTFQHMRNLMPTAPVSAGDGPASNVTNTFVAGRFTFVIAVATAAASASAKLLLPTVEFLLSLLEAEGVVFGAVVPKITGTVFNC